MSDQNFSKAFLILILSGIFLAVYPVLYPHVGFLQRHFKSYSLFPKAVKDSIGGADSLVYSATMPDSIHKEVLPPAYSGIEYLNDFFVKLHKGNSQIRIAYYGDSAIEGDMISQTLRDSLQKRYGGSGVGFVPIYSPIAGFRNTINQHASDNWQVWNFGLQREGCPFAFGYGGEVFSAKRTVDSLLIQPDSLSVDSLQMDTLKKNEVEESGEMPNEYTVRYIASKRYAGVSTLAHPFLFYGAPTDGKTFGEVAVTEFKKESKYALKGKKTVNRLSFAPNARKIALSFTGIDSMPIYGMSFESKRGVIVDNLPSRGNSGSWLMRLDVNVMRQFDEYFDVDLVILQYGLNVLNPKMTDYSWYKTEMKRVIAHVKRSFPKAAILIVGPSDKATKVNGEMVTDPSVPLITGVLRQAAEESEVAFFSLYERMGGAGTMVNWVEKKNPRWANLDYTHFNFQGARAAGGMLSEFLKGDFNPNR